MSDQEPKDVQKLSNIPTSLNRYGAGPVSISSIDNKRDENSNIQSEESSLSFPFSSGYETSLCNGTIHLLKQPFSVAENDDSIRIYVQKNGGSLITYPKGLVYAVLSIPSTFSSIDFVKWLGVWSTCINHFRFLKDGSNDRYICLLKFDESSTALSFSESMQGKLYSSFHPQQCYIVPIQSVEIISTIATGNKMTIVRTFGMSENQLIIKKKGKNATESIVPLESGWIELPTCPVCLERMDKATTGIMTTFCHHTFHCVCLSKWEGTCCPVCRFSSTASTVYCASCSSTKNLWICLICGNVGCGRYQRAHAYEHFLLTDHIFALDLSTKRVWDYVGDRYVHRLYQNKDDGKLLHQERLSELEDEMDLLLKDKHSISSQLSKPSSSMPHDVVYSAASMFSIQLESQKEYFQSQIDSLHKEYHEKIQNIKSAQEFSLSEKNKEISILRDHLRQVQKQIEELTTSIKEKSTKLEEEHIISSGLHQVVQKLTRQAKEKQTEIEELSSQISDLCLHLQAQEALESGKDSTIVTLKQPPSLINPGTINIIDKKKTFKKNR